MSNPEKLSTVVKEVIRIAKKDISRHMAIIGKKGGLKSRRVLTSEQARKMNEAKKRKGRNNK